MMAKGYRVDEAGKDTPQKTMGYQMVMRIFRFAVRIFYNPELNESIVVRPDGKISLQLVDDVQAAGYRASS